MDELRSRAERFVLESRINAHFIFNTLNAIYHSVMEAGNEESARMIKQLFNILQYTLSPDAEVTLGHGSRYRGAVPGAAKVPADGQVRV